MRTLKLTSPIMRGEDIKMAQLVLAGDNQWNKNFMPGKIDGEYGPQTAAAAYRAKYFLGFPRRKMNTNFGDVILAVLQGKVRLSSSYRWRMDRRQSASNRRAEMRSRALASAKRKRGLKETPAGSNHNWLTDWYYRRPGAKAPWCNISVSHSYMEAGSKAFKRGEEHAYVPFMEAAAVQGNRGLARIPISDLKPGDIVTYEFDGGESDHTGIFDKWVDRTLGTFMAEEGNTDAAGGAEGNEQGPKLRPVSQVKMAIRVLE